MTNNVEQSAVADIVSDQSEVNSVTPLSVVIDDGSKAAKMFYRNAAGELIYHLSTNTFIKDFRVAHNNSQPFNYLLEGLDRYSHHRDASAPLETTDVSHQYDHLCLLNVHQALHSSGLQPQAVNLNVSLPLSQFYTSTGERNLDLIERKKANLYKPVVRYIDAKTTAEFVVKDVKVFPESLPAITDSLEDGNIESFEVSLIIDLGGTTLDVASVTGKLEEVSGVKGFDKIGCSIVYSEIRRKLVELGLPSGDAYIDHLINNRDDKTKYKVPAEDIDTIHETVIASIKLLNDQVSNACKSVESHPHRVYIVGGGSYLIRDRISADYSKAFVKVIDNPQLALAKAVAETVLG